MKMIYRSLGIATAMILWALAATNGVIGERAFDVGFYGLIAASVVVIGKGRCNCAAAN
ncbi:MAG: hypothetical protein ABI412_00945 [Sphingomicrobium sp.]